MTPFDTAMQQLLNVEGGYSNNSADSGGATRFGITEAVARQFGYTGAMQELPYSLATTIYRKKYWDLLHLDDVAGIAYELAYELLDTAVNTGPEFAGRSLQRLLNVLNRNQRDYADIPVDALVGPATLVALRSFHEKRGTEGLHVLFVALNVLQGAFYIELTERQQKDEEFIYGWLSKRVTLNG